MPVFLVTKPEASAEALLLSYLKWGRRIRGDVKPNLLTVWRLIYSRSSS